jgi:energy-coupling factor transport system ATP-binding protein
LEILAVKDLSFKYHNCNAPAISNVDFSVEKGEFAVLCGSTGSGKSTLLRMFKRELTPVGELSGSVCFNGVPLNELDDMTSASAIGFVMQKPEQQIVTDKVWHELAFGLENLGVAPGDIARRIAEMASYFGIGDWFDKSVDELSGGQKQLLNLAAVLVMQPQLLILDEPTAQLDPIAASDYIATLKRLNQDFSLTIIIVEHRLEDVVPICDRLMIMDKGQLIANGNPRKVIASIKENSTVFCGMPAASRIYARLSDGENCPLTVKEGRRYISENFSGNVRSLHKEEIRQHGEVALEFKEIYFRYERSSPDVLKGLSFKVFSGEVFCILGGNGSGKTTALSAASGLVSPYSGAIKVFGKKQKEYKNRSLYRNCLTLLPQDVQTVFLKSSVRQELADCGSVIGDLPFDISALLDKHPYDLSGGEQQLVALAKVLSTKPRLLLLDEPTKGLDAAAKLSVCDIVRKLRDSGVTVMIVTHDVEFAALCADRCAMFFGGNIVSTGEPSGFFSENNFYTTAVSRMTRGIFEGAVTVEDAVELCTLNRSREVSDAGN